MAWPLALGVAALVLVGATRGAVAPLDFTQAGRNGYAVASDPRSPRVMVVGDSVGFSLAQPAAVLRDELHESILDRTEPGCELLFQTHRIRIDPPTEAEPERQGRPCGAHWADDVRRYHPDLVLFVIGATPTHEVYVGPGPNPVTVCDAAFTADLAPRLSAAFRRLGAGGASVTVTTMPYGITDGNPAMLPRTDCVNRTLAGTARSTRGVRLVDLNGFFCPHGRCARLLNGADPRPDGLHFQWPGVVPVVRWLFPQVAGRPPLTGASGSGGSSGSQAGMRSYCAAAKPAWSPVLDLAVPYGAAKDPSSGTGTLRNALAAVDVGRLRTSIDKAPADERPALRRLVNELDRAMRATVAHGYRTEPLRQGAVFGSGPNGPNDFVAATGFLRFTCGLPMYLVQLFPYR